jgi:hypothetical protein
MMGLKKPYSMLGEDQSIMADDDTPMPGNSEFSADQEKQQRASGPSMTDMPKPFSGLGLRGGDKSIMWPDD